jgi:hypothetical protein
MFRNAGWGEYMNIRSDVRLPVVALAVLLPAACIAGCGSSNSTHTTLEPISTPALSASATLNAAFIARANAVCARANIAIKKAHGTFPYAAFDPLHPEPKLLPKVGAFFASSQAIADRVPGELQALGDPERNAALWHQMLALTRQSRAIAHRQVATAEASNAPAFVATVREVESGHVNLGRLGIEAGFAERSPCGQAF